MKTMKPEEAVDVNPIEESNCASSSSDHSSGGDLAAPTFSMARTGSCMPPEAVEVNNQTRRKRRGKSSRNLRTKFRIESLYAEIRTLKRENEALTRILAEIRRNQVGGSDVPSLCNLRLEDVDDANVPRCVRFRGDADSGSSGLSCAKGSNDDCDEEDDHDDLLTDGDM